MQPHRSKNQSTPSLITTKQLAEMLSISTRQLHRMRSKGKIIQPIKLGRMTRWVLEDVEEWVRTGCESPHRQEN